MKTPHGPHTVYLGLGSNLGDRQEYLERAIQKLLGLPFVTRLIRSPVYETPPLGPGTGPYLNMVLEVTLESVTPLELLACTQKIEQDLGRVRTVRWGDRTCDIDLLLWDMLQLDTPALTLPHREMTRRWFVLKPLSDLAPTLRHPVLGETIQFLLTTLEEHSGNSPRPLLF